MPKRQDNPFLESGPFEPPCTGDLKALLVDLARERRDVTYAELLGRLGHRFTRPRMRALLHVVEQIDRAGMEADEPELAVLVVKASDRLPGRGWWTYHAKDLGYDGEATGPEAATFIRSRQKITFDYWNAHR